jgi:hypothetical protein
MREDKLRRLARRLDATAREIERRIQEERRIAGLRRAAAVQLHAVCLSFVGSVNALTKEIKLELAPPEYSEESFRDSGPNLFQINASGRIVQLAFGSCEPLVSREAFATPYILEGEVRWFNQESLEGMGVHEHLLFYCLENTRQYWLWFDSQTHRRGPVDEDYLADRFAELL